jgi:hypothetical protein
MSAKVKMYLAYAVSFIGLLLIIWFMAGIVLDPNSAVRKLTPILLSIIMSPKPYVVKQPSGNQYGLKSIFLKKIIWFKD